MYESLKQYCQQIVPLSEAELALIDDYFEVKTLKKRAFLVEEGKVCHFISFIAAGAIRHFHVKDGLEKTCDLSFENAWVTEFQSFTYGLPGRMNLQAMEDTTLFFISKPNLQSLYQQCSKYETFGRLMAELVARRATEIAMSLSADKPEERFNQLMAERPDLFQRIPQKYIANFLGVNPESLSRIRKRVQQRAKILP